MHGSADRDRRPALREPDRPLAESPGATRQALSVPHREAEIAIEHIAMRAIYLDQNATTPIDPTVLAEMLSFLREDYGNPSSTYLLGRRAREAIGQARADVAALLGAKPDEIVFTSGGTESSNIAIRGAAASDDRRTVVTSTIEHPATDECCKLLERAGYRIRRIRPDPDGRIDPRRGIDAVDRDTALVTIIHAQNEIGTLQPIAGISRAARAV